jgi:hypothetical protein
MSCRRHVPAAAAVPASRDPGCWPRRSCRGCCVHAGHRDPLPENRHHQRRGRHLPVVLSFGSRPVQVILVRDRARTGYDIALVTTDLRASPAAVIERHAARWSGTPPPGTTPPTSMSTGLEPLVCHQGRAINRRHDCLAQGAS